MTKNYNRFAIWSVAICTTIVITPFALHVLSVHAGFSPLKLPLQTTVEVCTLIALIGAIQCHRIGGGISDFLLTSMMLDKHVRPTDPVIIEFTEHMEQHPRWLTFLAFIGYCVCYTQVLCGTMLAIAWSVA